MQQIKSLSLKIAALGGPGVLENTYRLSMQAEFPDGTSASCERPVFVSRHSEAGLVAQNLLQTCLSSLETFSSEPGDAA